MATVYVPGSSDSGPAIAPGAKFSSVRVPLTHTSTVRPGTPCRTESADLSVSTAAAGSAPVTASARPAITPAMSLVRMVNLLGRPGTMTSGAKCC